MAKKEEAEVEVPAVSKNKRYRKDKPWDHDGIDHWKEVDLTQEDVNGAFLEESSFATLFPQYREKYLREVWPMVTRTLDKHGVACELNLIEGSMSVSTTRKTWDPFIILKARDMLKLLARSVPAPQAIKMLNEHMFCDVIKIGNIVRNMERFVKRRQRLIGPNGSTLKAIELLTECYVLVQGNTVSAMGTHKGLKQLRRIVEDCMHNIHPVYNIKALMIKRELAKDPALKEENWERFLPKFKKKNQKKKAPKKPKKKDDGSGNPFPPLPTPRKEDILMETGEYFLSEAEKRNKKLAEKYQVAEEKHEEKVRKRQRDFEAPPLQNPSALADREPQASAEALAKKLKKKKQKVSDDRPRKKSKRSSKAE